MYLNIVLHMPSRIGNGELKDQHAIITYCFLLLCTTNQTIPVITNKTTTPMETNIGIIDDY